MLLALLLAQSIQFQGVSSPATVTVLVAASDSAKKSGAQYVCDGTDDQVEINAAIASLPTNGGRVLLLEGTYTVTASINMKSNLWLQGQGIGTIVKAGASWTAPNYMLYSKLSGTDDNITISDLKLDANARSGLSHITFWGYDNTANNNSVQRCVITNSTGTAYGVLLQNAVNTLISDNVMSSIGDSCVEVQYASAVMRVTGNDFSSCSFQMYASTAGTVTTGSLSVTGNTFTNSTVSITPVSGAIVNGYVFAGNAWKKTGSSTVLLYIRVVDGMVIANNHFDSSTSTSVNSNPIINLPEATASNVSIRDNVFDLGTASSGTVCYGALNITGASSRISFTGNTVNCPGTTTASAVKVTANATDVLISGNQFVGAGAGATRKAVELDDGTRVEVSGNVFNTWEVGVDIAATPTASRVFDNTFVSVTTPYALLDTTALFREQAGLTFANLPADVADGSLVYCSDCAIASPCAGSGTGALAKRLNNTWICN